MKWLCLNVSYHPIVCLEILREIANMSGLLNSGLKFKLRTSQVHSRSTGHSSVIFIKSQLRYRLFWWKVFMVLPAGKFWASTLKDVLFPLAYFLTCTELHI